MAIKKRTVEITIPVYNEERELEENITKLHAYCVKNIASFQWQITIADNASTDATQEIAANLVKKLSRVNLIKLKQKGRGRAIKHAWGSISADYYMYMDVDLSTDLKHIPRLLAALEQGYDVAIGSRLARGSKVEGRTMIREITSRSLNFIFIQLFFRTHFTDAQCGFKAVTKRVVDHLIPKIEDNDWFFDGELLIVAEKSGYKIYEEPVHWVDNPGSTVRLVSTIWGDIKALWRLYSTRPWEQGESVKRQG